MQIEKTAYEEFFRFHDFAAWLTEGETVQSGDVVVTEKESGEDTSAAMASSVEPYNSTQIKYKLTGGTAATVYRVSITCLTTNGQKFEDRLVLVVT